MTTFLLSLVACNVTNSTITDAVVLYRVDSYNGSTEAETVRPALPLGGPAAAEAGIYFMDLDLDGFGDPDAPVLAVEAGEGMVVEAGDCDDQDPLVRPGEQDDCDGVDNNCNGQVDEDGVLWMDLDGDGFGAQPVQTCDLAPGLSEWAGDCDDNDGARAPGAPEQCNGLDDNCNLTRDDGADCGAACLETARC
jgi:hypothetical protein